MVVEKEYKQTEVGLIPVDWDVQPINKIATVIRGASPRPKGDKRYYGGNIPRLMVEDVTRDGKYVTPSVDFLTEEGAKRSRPCKQGTLTIVCSGTVGIPSFLKVDACIHDGFLGLTNIQKNTSSDYLYYQFVKLRDVFDKSATHGGIFTNLTTAGVKEFLLPIPNNIDEQTAIATALSDMDALIAQTEKLIEKKKAIKQGVMQELLRPKEGWVTKKLGEVCDLRNGYAFKSANYNQGGEYLIVTISNVQDGYLDSSGFNKIAALPTDIQDSQILKVGELLVSLTGNVGRICTVSLSNCLLNQRVGKLIPKNIDSGFLFYYLLNSTFRNIMIQNAVGGAQGNIGKGTVLDYELTFPNDLVEQKSIFEISSNIQLEIEKLEQKLEKLKLKKQGMMQALLTGKIRLV